LTALATCCLGDIFLQQQRCDQALASYQAALQLCPERAATERAIAAVWLHRGENPSEALRRARAAFEKERAGCPEIPQLKGNNLSIAAATLAWAVAASSGDSSEVERLTAEAVGLFVKLNPEKIGLFSHIPAGTTPVSTMAQVHLYCGLAFGVLGDLTNRANTSRPPRRSTREVLGEEKHNGWLLPWPTDARIGLIQSHVATVHGGIPAQRFCRRVVLLKL
jgi:hypothetical protein